VDPRASLDALEKRNISCPCRESNQDPSIFQLVGYSLYRLHFDYIKVSITRTLQIQLPVKLKLQAMSEVWFLWKKPYLCAYMCREVEVGLHCNKIWGPVSKRICVGCSSQAVAV
jgi:hypothetical protein